MKVVNVKVKYIRDPENYYENLEEWMKDPANLYIGRKNIVFINKKRFPEKDSFFANPYKIGKDGDRNTVINMYKKYIYEKLENNKEYIEILKKAKRLGCWCANEHENCHGDVLIEYVQNLNNSN